MPYKRTGRPPGRPPKSGVPARSLTRDEVLDVCARYRRTPRATLSALAREFNVSVSTVHNAIRRGGPAAVA
jgi:DNA invertase Pin-like site-specific DNA recombinase